MSSPDPNTHPAALRLLFACTVLVILVVLATNAAVILRLRESELVGEEKQLQNLSLNLAEQASRSFRPVDLVVSSLAKEIEAAGVTDRASFERKMAGHDLHLRLVEEIGGVPQLSAITVIGSDGKVIDSSRQWPIPVIDVSDRDYFRALRDDPSRESYISRPAQNRATGAWTIFLAHRVNGPHGEFLGIILGAIETRYFEDFYRAISIGEGTSIVMQRSDGVMLARFPQTDAIGKAFSNSEHLLQGGVSGVLRELSPIDGQMRLKAAHLVAGYPVLALATKTEEAALANWRGIARLMSLGAAGCALSIALAGFAIGRQWKQQAMLARAQADLRRQEDRTAAFEALAAAKEAAEMANRAKSEFLATISHELRTPLNAVLGFSEVMLSEVYGPLGNDRYRAYAKDIHASGSHLLSIVNDLLDLSKAAAGKLELDENWTDLRELLGSICRLIGPRIDAAKLSLTLDMPRGEFLIYADERLLKQMLLNLLSNACKFTPPGGTITCSLSVDDAAAVFSVADTGVGIPAEHLERVLLPFVQLDGALTRRHDGTGLGLALVKAMAELHGGALRLESGAGSGTTASIILPRHRLRSANETPAESPVSAGTA
jgi:signal transduction histidine kinase